VDLLCAGRAVILRGNPVGPPHLWFILTDPDPVNHDVVVVMVVTTRQHTDKSVILRAGDHPFIQHDSSLDYGGALRLKVNRLLAAVKNDKCELQPDMSPELLKRVRDGLLVCPRTVHHIVDYCQPRFL
jgi:hypothetical protein